MRNISANSLCTFIPGKALKNKKLCTKCHAELELDAIFCSKCGERQPEVEVLEAEVVENAENKDKNENTESNEEHSSECNCTNSCEANNNENNNEENNN